METHIDFFIFSLFSSPSSALALSACSLTGCLSATLLGAVFLYVWWILVLISHQCSASCLQTEGAKHRHRHPHTHTHTRTRTHIHAHTDTHTHTHTHTDTHAHAHMHAHRTHTHTRAHTHARKHTHRHTHIILAPKIVSLEFLLFEAEVHLCAVFMYARIILSMSINISVCKSMRMYVCDRVSMYFNNGNLMLN